MEPRWGMSLPRVLILSFPRLCEDGKWRHTLLFSSCFLGPEAGCSWLAVSVLSLRAGEQGMFAVVWPDSLPTVS